MKTQDLNRLKESLDDTQSLREKYKKYITVANSEEYLLYAKMNCFQRFLYNLNKYLAIIYSDCSYIISTFIVSIYRGFLILKHGKKWLEEKDKKCYEDFSNRLKQCRSQNNERYEW